MLKKLFFIVMLLVLVSWTSASAGTGRGRGSCVYCHNGSVPVDGGFSDCGGCHLNPPATGAHLVHTDGSGAVYGSDANGSASVYRFNCGNCHPGNAAKHGNGPVEVELYNAAATGFKKNNPASAGRTGTGSATVCSNIYCHSAGRPAGINTYTATPPWGGGFSGNRCLGCHSYPPSYANNAPKANSHIPHNFSCDKCHAGTTSDGATITNASAHVNGSFDVAPGSGTAFTYAYAATGGTCSNISCHGNTNATWGGTVDCGGCHGNPPPTAAAGYSGVNEATSPHMKHAGKGVNYSYACSQCHKGNKHGTGTFQDVFLDKSGILAGPAASYATGTRTCSSVYCHSNGSSLATGQPASGSAVWGSGTLGCNGCHANPPSYANNNPKTNSHLSPSHRVACNTCHAGTTTDGTTITNLTKHVNGAYDLQPGSGVTFTYSFATDGGTCSNISCHGALSATWGGTATCLVCHSIVQGSRAAITSQFGANSHHIQGAVTDAKCYQCHWEANSDGSLNPTYHSGSAVPGAPVDLVVFGAGARPLSYDTVNSATAVQYTANGTRGEIEKINSHCLGCHSDQNNSTTPFDDGKTPKQYAWDGTSVAARYAQSGKTTWGKYATVPNAAQKNIDKSYSAHGNSANNKRGWNTATGVDGAITNTSGAANVLCYDCHNSHGSTVTGVTTRYVSATANGGILKTTVAGQGGYAVAYKSDAGGSAAEKNQRNPGASLCLDCHLNQAADATPWGYTSTFGATQPILGYWDAPKYKNYTSSGAQQRFPYKKLNPTMGGHFGASSPLSTNPMSSIDGLCTPCHDPHGVSPTLGANQQYAVPLLKGTWLTSPYKEDVPPANNGWLTNFGGYGEGVQYHIDQNTFGSTIRGTVTGTSQSIDQSAGLCLVCHPQSSLTTTASPSNPNPWKSKNRVHESVKGWKTSDGTVEHNYSCSKCHSAHSNSVLPRLMVTNCLDGKHKGRTGNNLAPVTSAASSGTSGGGSGRIPGSYGGGGYYDYAEGLGLTPPGDVSVTCHDSSAANGYGADGTNQGWNNVTPWVDPTPIPPYAPTGIWASAGNTQVTIWWTAGAGSTSSLIQYGTTSGNYTNSIDPATSPRTITGLTNGTTIYYRVGAKNGVGTTWSNELSVTPVLPLPSVPTGVYATAGNAQVTISWTAGAGSTSSLIKYGTSSGVYTTTIDPATSPRTITGLTNGTTIYYRVGAKNAAGITWSYSQYSVTPVAPPSAPTGISATAGTGQVTISWIAGVGATSSLIRYGTTIGVYTTTLDPAASPRTITGLVNGTTIYFCVGAKNVSGITWSAQYSVTPVPQPPPAPTGISAATGNGQVAISWSVGTGTTSSLIRYGTAPGVYTTIIDPAASPQTITGLTNFTNIYYQVGARNIAGTTWSAEYGATPGGPSAPSPITINYAYYSSYYYTYYYTDCINTTPVTLSWNTVTAPDGDPVQYYVDVPGYGASGWIDGTSWTFPAAPASGYTWRVKARDAVHPAAESAFSSATLYVWDGASCGGSSCPLVYSWDGTEYKYETDLQGPALSQIKKGARNVTLYQPSYIVLESLDTDANDQYRVKIWESLQEATLLDEAKLLAVDYPEGYQIVSSGAENTYYYGYVNPFRIYTIKDPVQPITATDKYGSDILASILSVDDNPAPMAPDDPDNAYTFDFGTIQHPENAKLVIDGWQDINSKIFTSTVTIQPYIEVVDANGAWVKVKTFGMPMGDLKTLVIDIADIFLSSDHRIRIHLGIKKAQVWLVDRIRLDDSAPVSVAVQELEPSSADLQLGGEAIQSMPTLYHRLLVSAETQPINPAYFGYGSFTRYGAVGELLKQRDDKYVIMNYADKLELRFPSLSTPEPGMKRGFILKADLYYKEFKEYKYLDPLPFHGMSDYPYPAPETYPTDADHTQYRLEYNTREFTP